jgi:hypothetical protein
MRAVFVFAVVLSATVGLMISDGAEQPKRAVKPALPPPATTGDAEPSPQDVVPGIGAPLIGIPPVPATETPPPAYGLPQPTVTPSNNYPPPVAPAPTRTVPAPITYWAANPPTYIPQPYAPYPSHDQLQELRRQYSKLAEKRAERMEAEELKKGIADMRRNCLIAELMELGNNADGFDAMRAGVALAALSAKDRPDLEKLSRDLAKELAKATKLD